MLVICSFGVMLVKASALMPSALNPSTCTHHVEWRCSLSCERAYACIEWVALWYMLEDKRLLGILERALL